MEELNQRLNYIQNSIWYLYCEIYNHVKSWCSKDKPITCAEYLLACSEGNTKRVERALKKHDDYDKNEGLACACAHGHVDTAELLIENGADDFDRGLKNACVNNRYSTAELMVKKGADTKFGHRYSTSTNITRMLYRYEQGSEIIN